MKSSSHIDQPLEGSPVRARTAPVARHLLRRLLHADDGVSLTEVLVALVIFAIVMSGVLAGLLQSLQMTRDSRARQTAANLAAEEIDAVHATADFSGLAGNTWTRALNGETFTILRTVTPRLNGSSASPCDGGSDPRLLRFKAVNVRVTWENMAITTRPVRADTIVAPGAGGFDVDNGNVAVKVRNAQGSGVEGVAVTLLGATTSTTEFTDADGCVFLIQVEPGTYTVSVSAPGYVDPTGAPEPSQTVVVDPAYTTSAQFDYDEAASLEIAMPRWPYPAPANVPLTLWNSQIVPTGTLAAPGSGLLRRIDNLFPFAAGYSVWAGSCADADPEGVEVDASGNVIRRYHPGATRPPAIPAIAGEVTRGSVTMAPVEVELSPERSGVSIRAVHVADSGCPAGEVYYPGVTDEDGELQFSLPWGTWTIEAVGRMPFRSWPTVTLSPTSRSTTNVRVWIR